VALSYLGLLLWLTTGSPERWIHALNLLSFLHNILLKWKEIVNYNGPVYYSRQKAHGICPAYLCGRATRVTEHIPVGQSHFCPLKARQKSTPYEAPECPVIGCRRFRIKMTRLIRYCFIESSVQRNKGKVVNCCHPESVKTDHEPNVKKHCTFSLVTVNFQPTPLVLVSLLLHHQ